MGVLTDILIASEDDARIGAERVKVDTPDRLDLKGVDLIAFSCLYSILGSREPDGSAVDEFEQVYEGKDGEEWIWRFPREFTEWLLLQEPADTRRCAEAWSNTEEMEGLSPEGCAEIIGWLIYLAQRADVQGKQMYCWMSL